MPGLTGLLEGTIMLLIMELYHSGKKGSIVKPKPKLALNPRWKGDLIPRDQLQELYINQGFGFHHIAKLFSINVKSVRARLVYYGIPVRSLKEGARIRKYPNGHRGRKVKANLQQIIDFIHSGLTKNEIATNLKICEKTIYASLQRAGAYDGLKALIKLNAIKHNWKPHGYLSKELGHRVRSTWEEKLGLILRDACIAYQYEPFFLPLSRGAYLPDYKVKSIIIEIKGQIYNDTHNLLLEAIASYPEYHFWLISDESGVHKLGSLFERSYALFRRSNQISNEAKIALLKDLEEIEVLWAKQLKLLKSN